MIRPHNLRLLIKGIVEGDDIRWLHYLLNQHLGPNDDQLPVQGAGARAFGPRTEAKVKRFQKLSKVLPRLKDDGVVGPLTWAALETTTEVKTDVWFVPDLVLPPLTLPPLSPMLAPQSLNAPIPVPKLTLDPKLMFQLQTGESVTWMTSGPPHVFAHNYQITTVILGKADQSTWNVVGGLIGTINNNRANPGQPSSGGLVFAGGPPNLNVANNRFSFSASLQEAVVKNSQKGMWSAITSVNGLANWNIINDSQGNAVLALGAQGSFNVFQLDFADNSAPAGTPRFKGSAGFGLGLVLSVTFTNYKPVLTP